VEVPPKTVLRLFSPGYEKKKKRKKRGGGGKDCLTPTRTDHGEKGGEEKSIYDTKNLHFHLLCVPLGEGGKKKRGEAFNLLLQQRG